METIDIGGCFADPGEADAKYVEHLRSADLSLGTYSLRSGACDHQSPHGEEEVYVVTVGEGRFTSGGQTVDVRPGSVLFVPANEEHRFHDITTDLAALVFFGPAEGSRPVAEAQPDGTAGPEQHR